MLNKAELAMLEKAFSILDELQAAIPKSDLSETELCTLNALVDARCSAAKILRWQDYPAYVRAKGGAR